MNSPILQSRIAACPARRGSAMIAVVIVLVILQFIVLGIAYAGSRDHNATSNRIAGVQCFYAAEGITNMAVREMIVDSDEDGDGVVGEISVDGNSANNPNINGATGTAAISVAGSTTTITITVTGGNARRKIQVTIAS